jgi:hypothetical protein
MMRATKKKKLESDQSGSGAVTFSDLDLVILDVINPESAAMKGLGQPDDPPSFESRNENDSSLFDVSMQSSFNFGNFMLLNTFKYNLKAIDLLCKGGVAALACSSTVMCSNHLIHSTTTIYSRKRNLVNAKCKILGLELETNGTR